MSVQGTDTKLFLTLINRVCEKLPYSTGLPLVYLESDKLFLQNVKTIIELSQQRLSDVVQALSTILDNISKSTQYNIEEVGAPAELLQSQLFILKLLSSCMYYYWNNIYIDSNSRRKLDEYSNGNDGNQIPVRPPRGKTPPSEKKHNIIRNLEAPPPLDENLAKFLLGTITRFFQTSSSAINVDAINHNTFSLSSANLDNPSIASCIPEFKPITDIKEILSTIIGSSNESSYSLSALETFREIQRTAGKIIFYLSSSNWIVIFQRIKSRLIWLSSITTDLKPGVALSEFLTVTSNDALSQSSGNTTLQSASDPGTADLTELRFLEWCCLNRTRLSMLIQEFCSCIKTFKKSAQLVSAILFRKAIWNWIDVYPTEFASLCQNQTRLEGGPDVLFDILHILADNNKRKAIFWPLQTMLLILCPDILFNIGLGDHSNNINTGGIIKKSIFLETLRKCLKANRLSDVSAFCYVDICRASTFVSKTDGSALRLLVPNIEVELKERLFDITKLTLNQSESIIDQQLLIDCLTSLLKLNPSNTLRSLMPIMLQDNAPMYFRVVLVKSCYSIVSERVQLPWNPSIESMCMTLAGPLKLLFLDNLVNDRSLEAGKRSNLLGNNSDKKQRRAQMEEANEKVEIITYILKIWNKCPNLALTGGPDILANKEDIRRLMNGLTICTIDSNTTISRTSSEILIKLFSPENIEQWDGTSRIDVSVYQQGNLPEGSTFNAIPLYIKTKFNERSLNDQIELMKTFWKVSSQVILSIAKQILEIKVEIDNSLLRIAKLSLELLKTLLSQRNNYLAIHRNIANQGINHQDRYSCSVVLEIGLLVFICSADTEVSYLAVTCFELLSQEAIFTGEMDDENMESNEIPQMKRTQSENERTSHLENLAIYRNLMQQLNSSVITSQKVQQKRIRSVLRGMDRPSVGSMGAYEEIYRRWKVLTSIITTPNKGPINPASNFGSPIVTNGTWDEYYMYDDSKKKNQRYPGGRGDVETIYPDDKGEWQNYTGFLCALGGCCIIAGRIVTQMMKQGNQPNQITQGMNKMNLHGINGSDKDIDQQVVLDIYSSNYLSTSSIINLYSNGYALIDKFVHELIELMVSDNVMVREAIKEMIGNELSTLLYSNFFKCLEVYLKQFFDESGEAWCNDRNTLFIENAISIFKCLVERDDTTDYLGSMDLGGLLTCFTKYANRLGAISSQVSVALRIKVRISQLCDLLFAKKEFARLCNSVKFRNKLVETFVEWTSDFVDTQGDRPFVDDISQSIYNKEAKLQHDLDLSCMKTITSLLVQLPIQPEDIHETNVEEEKGRIFNKYFTFFIKLLKRCRILEAIENGEYRGMNVELQNLLLKSKEYIRWMGPLKDYAILALSNLLSSNIDIGLKYSLSLGYHEDTKTRAAFMQVFTNILNQVTDFEGLSEDNKNKVTRDRYKKLVELFVEPDLTIALALCEVAPVGEIDEVAQLILALFKTNHELTLRLIKTVVEKEVSKTESPANLFRRNSMATRLLTLFAKSEGSEYLRKTLQPYLIELVNHSVDKCYEIDPAKIQFGDKVTNLENLKNTCQGFVDVITNSQGIPPCFVELCTYIAKVVGEKFPGSPLPAVGGFIFLRFFCPAIVSPDGHDLVTIPPSAKELRRGLVLSTKIIQNLANNVLFGIKETFMIKLNDFLKSNITPVTGFLKRISGLDSTLPVLEPVVPIPPENANQIDQNVINKLHHYLVENQDKIERIGKEMVSRRSKHSRKNTLYSNNNNKITTGTSITNSNNEISMTPKNKTAPGDNQEETEQPTIPLRSSSSAVNASTGMKKTFDQLTTLLNQLGPAPEVSEPEAPHTYVGKAGVMNQLFMEFLQRNEHRNIDSLKEKKIFYEGGLSKDRNPVFYLITRRIIAETLDVELFLYYILTIMKPYFGKPYELVVDASQFGLDNEIQSNYWLQVFQILPIEAAENFVSIYFYNVNTLFKKWSKRFAKFLFNKSSKKIIFASSLIELYEHISQSELKLPKSTILLEKEVTAIITPVVRISHYRQKIPVVLKISKDYIQVTTVKKQEMYGMSAIINDIYHISEIEEIICNSDNDDNEFLIRYDRGNSIMTFSSTKRDLIIQAIRASRTRFQYLKPTNITERVLRPSDVPGTLLNMALLNTGSDDATLRLSAYNLLYSLSLAFSFDVDNQLYCTKGLCIPMNSVNFVVSISERLARTKPELTLELLLEAFVGMKKSTKDLKHYCLEYISPWIPNLALFATPGSYEENEKSKQSHEKMTEVLKQFIDFSISEFEMYPSIQTKIWKVLGESEEIVSEVLDVFIQKAIGYGTMSSQAEVIANTIVSYASANVQLVAGKIISKLRKRLKVSAFNGAVSLTDHPNWDELSVLIRLILMLSFSNNIFVNQYLPELFHIVTMFVGVGSPLIRASIHGLVVNLIHSMCISLPLESETLKNLQLQLSDFVEPKFCILFGLNRGVTNAFVNVSEAMSDPYEGITLSALETVSTTLLNIMTYGALNEEISATWKSRWMSLITSSAFQYNPALQPRAFVAMGCLARDEVDDDLLYQILVALRNALALYDQTECTYIISIIMCLTNVVENLPIDSRYMSPMFWLGMSLIQIGNIPLFQSALNLLQVVLRTLEANECFAEETVSSYLMKAREPLNDIVSQMDMATGIHFVSNFQFAVSANLLKGLRHPATKASTISLLMTFLEISGKACGGVCIETNNTVGPELIGLIAPLLPTSEKVKELLWNVGVIDELFPETDMNAIDSYNKIPKIIDKLSLNDENAILLVTMMVTMLQTAEYETELLFIYHFLAETADTIPDIFLMIYDSLLPRMNYVISNSQSPVMIETVQSILTSIINRPANDNWQNSPRRHQLIPYLTELGFSGLPECGTFQNISKARKIKLSQLSCAIVESIVS